MFKKTIITVFCLGLVLLMGCETAVPEPAFLTDKPWDHKDLSEAKQREYKGISRSCAEMGWSYLNSYFNKTNFVPAFNRSYVAYAMTNFNYCWYFDNENCEAYWGAGAVRRVQSTLTGNLLLKEKHLKQSVEFILLARKLRVPSNKFVEFSLDLAYSYKELGAFYLQTSEKELANANLELARETLLDVIKSDPENYAAYWGAGVISGEQATLADDQLLVGKYLKQSLEFMLLAKKQHVPANKLNNLSLDLANSHYKLGAFYLQTSEKELAKTNLELSRTILLDVIKSDPENYHAYWVAAVVSGEQANLGDDQLLVEKYLKQCLEFMLLAKKYHVPANKLNEFNLDLANCYNGLGAFYLQTSEKGLADANLKLARATLLDVIKKEPDNGRAFFLLAATAFYQEKYNEAKQLVEQAQSKHFKVPDDFLKDLSSKISTTVHPQNIQ